ncbi:PEP-CTERM sorting domain-containing protein [Candidatus Poribacteria bacterium]|nr:PEP-CTERM sorting domain-containing protein [Candidatus Poribacteria bacterium]
MTTGHISMHLLTALIVAVATTPTFFPSAVQAVPVVVHQGSHDPATEGWTLNMSGVIVGNLAGGTETTASGSHDFWHIQDLSTTGVSSYTHALNNADLSGNWRFEAGLRIIDSPVCPGCLDVGGTGVIVADGMNYWSFYVSNSGAGPISDSGKTGLHSLLLSTSLDTRSDYHHYAIDFSQNGPGSSDDTADFFVDGVLVFNDVGRTGLWTSSAMFVHFGPVSTGGTSDANFELVRFDNGAPQQAIPEPSTLTLLVVGLAGLVVAQRRRKRAQGG